MPPAHRRSLEPLPGLQPKQWAATWNADQPRDRAQPDRARCGRGGQAQLLVEVAVESQPCQSTLDQPGVTFTDSRFAGRWAGARRARLVVELARWGERRPKTLDRHVGPGRRAV